MKTDKNRTNKSILIVLIIMAVLIGMTSLSRPKVKSSTASEAKFSAERAMEHVNAISQDPHPAGSSEIEIVRQYILTELRDLGLDPEIQNTVAAYSWGSSVEATSVQNIIVKIPGMDSSQAILMDAHYDTRAMTPGASDCGGCVATVLETTRAVLAGPPLKNDLILLFTDNEEYGAGLGAAAFVKQHSLADEVGLVLNFEGLGSTGPSILFESGPDSGWAVREWGKTAALPVGQSWFYEIYRLTPIGTDLNHFSDAGIPGLNFGYWARGYVYHSALDNPDSLDHRSLQHHGSYALSLINNLGNKDLNEINNTKGDAVFFSLLPTVLITYPAGWSLPIAILAGAILGATYILGHRRNQLSIRGVLKGLAGFILSLVGSAGLATGIWMGLNQLHSQYLAMFTFRGVFFNTGWYFWSFAFLAATIATLILSWLRKKTAVPDLYFGALVFFWIMAGVTAILFPGFSYLFSWPVIFSSLTLGWVVLKGETIMEPGTSRIILTAGSLPGLILITPCIYIMYHFALAPMLGILPFMVALALGLLIPAVDTFTKNRTGSKILAGVIISLAFLVIGSFTAEFDAGKPQPNAVAYLQDAESREAFWFSAGYIEDSWTDQFFPGGTELIGAGKLFPIERTTGFPVRYGPAPMLDLPTPELVILSDSTVDGVRRLEINLMSPRGAEVLLLDINPYQAVFSMDLGYSKVEPTESTRDIWSLTYYAVPEEGINLILELDPDLDVRIQLSDQTWAIPLDLFKSLEREFITRSDSMMAMPNFDYGSVVSRIYELK